jgi:hypothetical protein
MLSFLREIFFLFYIYSTVGVHNSAKFKNKHMGVMVYF